jgi:PAS domain S-box-containing protein
MLQERRIMRIRTRLHLNTGVILLIMSLMAISLVWSFRESDKAHQKESLVVEMEKTAYERVVLRDDYLMRREERARVQWNAKTAQFRKFLEDAHGRCTDMRDASILESIRKRFDETVLLFSQLTDYHEKAKAAGYERSGFLEQERQMISYVIASAYDLMNHIRSLKQSASMASDTALQRSTLLVFFFMCVIVIGTIVNSAVINRILTKRIAELSHGSELIGAGNLDHRIPVTGNDELAELAKASNDMSAKLQASHTSLENLHREIRERKQAEEAMRETERAKSELLEKLNEAQHIAMIGSWEWDLLTNHVWWSDETYCIFGVTQRDIVPSFEANGRFIHPDDFAKYGNAFEHCLKTGEALNYDFRLVADHGRLKHCQSRGQIIYDDSGQAIRFIGTLMDNTERKRLEDELRNLNAELEKRVKDRTAELEAKIAEIEGMNKLFVGRELRMAELKQRIKELEAGKN